jgi:hypothetical protein
LAFNTAVGWIAIVNAMSDRPNRRLGVSNISVGALPKTPTSRYLIAVKSGSCGWSQQRALTPETVSALAL